MGKKTDLMSRVLELEAKNENLSQLCNEVVDSQEFAEDKWLLLTALGNRICAALEPFDADQAANFRASIEKIAAAGRGLKVH